MAYKRAFITGITGQDGYYLTQFLLNKGYEVHGLMRRSSGSSTQRLDLLPEEQRNKIYMHYGDMTDSTNIVRLLSIIEPDEIYNLAAQSHVAVSFETPEYTAQADALGVLRILEAIRILGLTHKTKFYQASTSELFGSTSIVPQSENTPFAPRSPYAAAKLYAYWIVVNYRQAYNIFACNGILFNHESPLRGETFITRKVTRAVTRISLGLQDTVQVGNLYALRDWGYAPEYVDAMWRMLQHSSPEDFVIATGTSYSVKDWINWCFDYANMPLIWEGAGVHEVARDARTGVLRVQCNPQYYRPTEVDILQGNALKARQMLDWKPLVYAPELAKIMMAADIDAAVQQGMYGSLNTISQERWYGA